VPLAPALLERLEAVPSAKRKGPVASRGRYARWEDAARVVIKCLREACPEIPRERVGWNAFRHTFGSLLAQEGVSLDKISAWMGNSPEVCRRHYAQFVPRDRHDEDIERL